MKLVWSNFEKIGRNLFHQIDLMNKSQSKLESPTCEEKITKIKLQTNEHEISIHTNNNSGIQIVQPEFTTWKYKVKLSVEAASGSVL